MGSLMGILARDGNLLTRSAGSNCATADLSPFLNCPMASSTSPLIKPARLPDLNCFSNRSLAVCSVNPSGVVTSNFCPVGEVNENFGIKIFIDQGTGGVARGKVLPVDRGVALGSSVTATIFTPLSTGSAVGGGVGALPVPSDVLASVPLL